MSSELRSPALWGALVLGVALRAEYLRELLHTPFGRHPVLDGIFYENAARQILNGAPLAADPACFRAPLYPFFLAAVHAVAGDGLLAPRLVQLALGLVTIVLVRAIARRTHGERVANVAGFLAAGYGMFIYHEAEILGVALGVLLQTLATLLLLDAGRRGSLGRTIAGGLALGLTAITHATALVLAPVAFFWLLAVGRRGPRGPLALRLAALTVAVTLPVSLATLRNRLVTGDFVLVATQGGINLYVGNNPEADGRTSLVPGTVDEEALAGDYRDLFEVAAENIAERATGREMSAGEINAYWTARAGAWMRANPGDAARLLGQKALLFWTGLESSNNRDLEDQAQRWTPILAPFLRELAFLMPLVLLGLFLHRGRSPESTLLVGFIVAYWAAITAFFVCSRFRQPVLATMMPFAAAGAVGLFDSVRGAARRPGATAGTLALLAALFLVTNQNLLDRLGVVDLSLPNAPFHRYNLGVLLAEEGNLEAAVEEYRAARELHPEDPRIGLNLGSALLRLGREDEAIAALERVAALSPVYAERAQGMIGAWAVQQGDWDEAIARFRAVLRARPESEEGRLALGAAYLAAGRPEDAAEQFRLLLERGTRQPAVARRNLGLALLELGRLDEAERHLDAARAAMPDDPTVAQGLARLRALRARAGAPGSAPAPDRRPGDGGAEASP
jgi:Flp pilus assembly protein TadD